MSTLDIIEKKEEQSEEDTTSWKSKITFDKIKKENWQSQPYISMV